MKALVFSMLAMAAMVSCTSESDPINDGGNEKVEIKLNAGVIGVVTKAAISATDKFTPQIAGWEGSAAPTVETDATWSSSGSEILGNATSATITLAPKQYYNPDNTVKTFIRGYYPVGSITGSSVVLTNTTGDQDIILSDFVDAGAKPTGSTAAKNLIFTHKLSQLNFKVIGDASLAIGTTLTSITIKDAALPTSFDISTGVITYATATDLSLAGITANLKISATEAPAGNAVMIKPTGAALSLDIVTNNGSFQDVPVTLSAADTNGGTSYTITLTFKQKEIITTATVTDWTQGTGTGEVI